MPSITNYRGIIPAISCPFTRDHKIDEPALRKLASWLAGHEGIVAVMTNGHTGEVFSLTPAERTEVTRIVADEAATTEAIHGSAHPGRHRADDDGEEAGA